MGQRSMSYSNHFMDLGADQQSQAYIHPEPCVLYGSYTALPRPNAHNIVPASGTGNFYVSHQPGQGTLIYGMPPANGIHQWQPLTNVGPAVAPSSNYFYPYVAAPSASTGSPVPVDQGLQLPLSGTHGVVGNNADNLRGNDPQMDSAGGSFKQKNVSAGSSTSVAPAITTAHESDVSMNDTVLSEHGGNDSASSVDNGVQISASRSASGPEIVLPDNNNQLLQGNYVGQAYQFPGNPWVNQPFNSSGTQTWAWNQAAPFPYLPGGGGGYVPGAGNIGMLGYQVTSSNGGMTSFLYPPIHQGPLYPHHMPPNMQFTGGHPVSFSPQMAASSSRHLTNGSSSNANNPLQAFVEGGSGYMRPLLPTGFRMYRPRQTEFMRETNARHHNFPNGVRIGYHGVGVSLDQHRDMRLDIDHMSYEELLALGERIGNVRTGLSEEVIGTNLKTRIFLSTETLSAPGSVASEEEHKTNFCVICQTEYTGQEKIGILECGHDYHQECIKKWLVVKNTCAICNSVALSPERMNV